ncbi:hypothetical protein BKA70DRAFT_1428214 [Coprinopsis sp. MPI-PUGE-AT-0042]|nr:hypothetical protein BKA70DRAFT_1428214 [Coprinopsis sp. MPI-PUGE-AT-0042]
MPKDPTTPSARVTRSRNSQATSATSARYRQVNSPHNMRLALGRQHAKPHTEAEDTPAVSSSESDDLSFRIIAGAFQSSNATASHGHDGPSTESLSEISLEEVKDGDVHSQPGTETTGSSDSAPDLLAIIQRQKRQLQLKTSSLARSKREVKALKERIVELDEELELKQSMLDGSQKNEVQYRNWWLNEIQFTKLLLNKIPNPNRDIDLVRASQAHYVGHY